MSVLSMLKSGLKGVFLGGAIYMAGDQASDMITYSRMHTQAMELVANDPQIPQMIGEPFTSGAWHDATLAFSHRDKVAHCTFQLQGSKGVTDVAVKAGRQAGYKSNILYNTIGSGQWQLMSCQVMVPSEGGLVAPRSLMPEHQQQQQQQQSVTAAADCQPCQKQRPSHSGTQHVPHPADNQQPGQQQQPGPEQRRWGHKLWWRRRQQQLQQQQQQQQQQQPQTEQQQEG